MSEFAISQGFYFREIKPLSKFLNLQYIKGIFMKLL